MPTIRYYVTVATVTVGASAQFYSYGIVNPAQILIMDWINSTFTTRYNSPMDVAQLNVFWSFVVSSVAIGAIIGSLLTRTVAEHCGRRDGLLLNGIANVIGACLELFAKSLHSPELLIVGRLILGMNIGLSSGLAPIYLMEISPLKYRGVAGTLHQVAVAFSDWFSLFVGLPEVLGSESLWPLAFGFPGILALALCVILPFCPESPKYTLVSRGNKANALHAVRLFVGNEKMEEAFEEIVKEAELSEKGTGSYYDLFTRKDLRIPLLVSVLVMVSQQFTGCTVVFAYSTHMFVSAKLSPETARFSTLAIGIAYFVFACSAPFLIERLGRRLLSLFQLASCDIALVLLTVFTGLQAFIRVTWASYASIAALFFYMCVYGVGSPIPWMISAEIFTTKFRPAAVTVTVFVSWSLAFVISTAYLPFQQIVGVTLSYLPFIIVSSINLIFIFILLPETRGLQPDEIVNEIRSRSRTLRCPRIRQSVSTRKHGELSALLGSEETVCQYQTITA